LKRELEEKDELLLRTEEAYAQRIEQLEQEKKGIIEIQKKRI